MDFAAKFQTIQWPLLLIRKASTKRTDLAGSRGYFDVEAQDNPSKPALGLLSLGFASKERGAISSNWRCIS